MLYNIIKINYPVSNIMTYAKQEIKPELKEEFFSLVNSLRRNPKTDIEKEEYKIKTERFEEILRKENLNPAQIGVNFNYSLISWTAMSGDKGLFRTLLKYTDDSKTPPSLLNTWYGLSVGQHTDLIKRMVKTGDFSNINTPTAGGDTAISIYASYLFSEIYNSKRKGSESLKPSTVFSPNFITLLEHGGDLNIFYEKKDIHLVSALLHPFKGNRVVYQPDILTKSLEYGFNPNLIFDKETGNNFIQDLLIKREEKSFYFKDLLNLIFDYSTIDYNYKNKEGKTVLDTLNTPELQDVKHYFEKGFIQLAIEDELDHTLSPKKRL